MTPETIAIVGVGVTLLVAVAATYFSLRRNSNDRFSTLEEKVDALAKDFYLLHGEVKGRLQTEFERELRSLLLSRNAETKDDA